MKNAVKTFVTSLFLFGTLMFVIECKHEPLKQITGGDTTVATQQPVDTTICFERDILPLFVSNCATTGCHNATSKRDGYNLTTYTSIMSRGIVAGKPTSSKLYRVMEDGSMPIYTTMPADQIALIKKWILQGAKNGTNCPSRCDSSNFKFAANIQPMLKTYCVGCHSTSNAGGGVALDSYTGVASAASSGRLWGSINGLAGYSFMPKGGAAMSSCQKAQIRKWIAAGSLNN